jgi:hypothetical protein
MGARRGFASKFRFVRRRRSVPTSSVEGWVKLLGAIATAIGAVAAMAGGSKLGGGDSQASSAPPGAGVPPPERATQSSVPERGPLSETRAVSQLRPAPAAFSMNAKSTPGYPLAADPRYPICIDTDSGRVVFCEDNFVFSVQDQCRTGTNIEGIRDLLSLGERHPDAVSRLSDKLRACYLDLFNHVRPHERSMKDALREAREKAEGDPTLEVVLHDARDLSSSIVYIGNSRGRKLSWSEGWRSCTTRRADVDHRERGELQGRGMQNRGRN